MNDSWEHMWWDNLHWKRWVISGPLNGRGGVNVKTWWFAGVDATLVRVYFSHGRKVHCCKGRVDYSKHVSSDAASQET